MDNRQIPETEQAPETAEKYPNRFKKGQSGNPSGRPKMTQAEKDSLKKIREMVPEAVKVMSAILADKKASCYAKIQVITIILNRAYGLPVSSVKVSSDEQTMEESIACVEALLASLRPEEKEEPLQ